MQKGFATLEVILMVMVIGILASIAVPRITSVTTAANTAKIQADLTTIDTAIAVYQMEIGSDPTTMAQLVSAGYLQAEPKPPTGNCYIDGSPTESPVPGTSYDITGTGSECHAIIGTGNSAKAAGNFYLPKKSS